MDQEEIDKVVLAYLEKRGFKQAGLAFQQEKHNNASSTAQIDPDIAKQLVAFAEVDSPAQYQEGYSKFRSWAYSSLDQYQHELVRVLYPVFIHGFMDLVAKGHIQEARAFFNSFRGDHEVTHSRDLQKLEGNGICTFLEAEQSEHQDMPVVNVTSMAGQKVDACQIGLFFLNYVEDVLDEWIFRISLSVDVASR